MYTDSIQRLYVEFILIILMIFGRTITKSVISFYGLNKSGQGERTVYITYTMTLHRL